MKLSPLSVQLIACAGVLGIVIAYAAYAVRGEAQSESTTFAQAQVTPPLVEPHDLAQVPLEQPRLPAVRQDLARDLAPPSTPEQRSTSVGDYLAAYWGNRWPELSPSIRLDLTAPVTPPLPWPEVAPRACASMRVEPIDWSELRLRYKVPLTITYAWLRQNYQIDLDASEDDVRELGWLLRIPWSEGERALAGVVRAIDRELIRKCTAGDFQHDPLAMIPHKDLPKDRVYFGSFQRDGWWISYAVRRAEIPEAAPDFAALDRVQQDMQELVTGWKAVRSRKPVSR